MLGRVAIWESVEGAGQTRFAAPAFAINIFPFRSRVDWFTF